MSEMRVNALLHDGEFVPLIGRISLKQLRAAIKGGDSNKELVFSQPSDEDATAFDADGNPIFTYSIVTLV